MVEMEQSVPAKLTTAMGEIREELGAERVAHQQLDERLVTLNNKIWDNKENMEEKKHSLLSPRTRAHETRRRAGRFEAATFLDARKAKNGLTLDPFTIPDAALSS